MPRANPCPRGFTLIELVIAMAVTALVLTTAIVAANGQQRAFYDGQRARATQDSARMASVFLEQKLSLIGYGMDPSLAIDFSYHGCATQAACARDSITGPDELVFYARDPDYWLPQGASGGPYSGQVWALKALATNDTTATLVARTGDRFAANQILQAVCPGTLKYAYFTVGDAASAGSNGDLVLTLKSVDASNPFQRQDVARTLTLTACPGATPARVFRIDRYRFYIKPVDLGAGRYVPYLALDRGTDEVLVAEGIEDLQVAYVFSNPAAGQAGATANTAITFSVAANDQKVSGTPGPDLIARTAFPGTSPTTEQTTYTPSSFYRYVFSDPIRQTTHQANIRAVRIAMVARSVDPDPTTRTNLVVDSNFTLLNQKGAPSWVTGAPKVSTGTDGYQRLVVDFTVDLPNMSVRSLPGF